MLWMWKVLEEICCMLTPKQTPCEDYASPFRIPNNWPLIFLCYHPVGSPHWVSVDNLQSNVFIFGTTFRVCYHRNARYHSGKLYNRVARQDVPRRPMDQSNIALPFSASPAVLRRCVMVCRWRPAQAKWSQWRCPEVRARNTDNWNDNVGTVLPATIPWTIYCGPVL